MTLVFGLNMVLGHPRPQYYVAHLAQPSALFWELLTSDPKHHPRKVSQCVHHKTEYSTPIACRVRTVAS
jgi:hypothetical protein